MSQKRKVLAKKELEKIYDNQLKSSKTSKGLRREFKDSLRKNPVLGLILKLAVMANIGIWTSLGLIILGQF